MAYSEIVANRIREYFADFENVEEKEMMGGLVFMYNGKMCVGVIKDDLMCRIDKNFHHQAVEKNGCRTMDFTSKPMMGYVVIDETGMQSKKEFAYWMELAIDFNQYAKASKKRVKKSGLNK